jgi:hypothetical protein
MASATPRNAPTIGQLEEVRDRMVQSLPEGQLYPLPTASFHQTVVSTFSAQRREEFLVAKGLEADFPALLRRVLGDEASPAEDPVEMHLIGLSFFRTAMGVLGVFPRQAHFARVRAVRDRVYGHPQLSALGLTRTRPFIGHITLAYVEAELRDEERKHLTETALEVNRRLAARPLPYFMPVAALHRYDTLAAFERPEGYPQLRI